MAKDEGSGRHRLPYQLKGAENWAIVYPIFEQRFKSEGLMGAIQSKATGPESDKAMSLIMENVAPQLLSLISCQSTAGSAWELLKLLFGGTSRPRVMVLKALLYGGGMRRRDGEEMAVYIARWTQLALDLANVGQVVAESEIAWGVLAGLPAEYQRAVFSAVPDSTPINLSTIVGTLAAQDLNSGGSGSSHSGTMGGAAVMAGAAITTKKPLPKRKGGPQCWLCEESGHVRDDCPYTDDWKEWLAAKKQKRAIGGGSRSLQVASAVVVSGTPLKQEPWMGLNGVSC